MPRSRRAASRAEVIHFRWPRYRDGEEMFRQVRRDDEEFVQPGQETTQATTSMDWTATILSVTGTKPNPSYPLDGEDILPVCTGDRPAFDRTLFWRNNLHDAARVANWKYLREQRGEHLFDLVKDPGERNDLKERQPEMFESLRSKYKEWNGRMEPVRS
jgi:arylsulfatase A-like enzyme